MEHKIALVVEDTEANRLFFEKFLTQAGFHIRAASDGKSAREIIDSEAAIALAIIDMEIPDTSGLQLTLNVREKFPDCVLIIATMHDERALMQSAYEKGCDVFLVKPHGFMLLFKLLTEESVETIRAKPPLLIDQYGLREFPLGE